MNKYADVLVIGAGLSGLMAAAKAVEDGKKVTLAAKGMGALGLSSGCIDLWGYSLDDPYRVSQDPWQDIARLCAVRPQHPYARLQDVLKESLLFFQQLCQKNGNQYLAPPAGNRLLPTALGTWRPTYLAPAGMAADNLQQADHILVVGFEELKDFYPHVLAANISKSGLLKTNCRVNTAMVSAGGGELSPGTLAHRLEDPARLADVAAQIKPGLQPEAVLLLPPVCGERWDTRVLQRLSQLLGHRAYEVTNIPPALPGQRLQQMLLHHLKQRGVEVLLGCTVSGARLTGKRCSEVLAGGAGKTINIAAKTVVLATGSFLGGGLWAEPGQAWESIFRLPVAGRSGKWSARDFLSLEGHLFNQMGINVNDNLQPVDDAGRVILENVLVTGANLAGSNHSVEKCGNGVAVASGYKAGKLAGEVF
ncbi:anaerobic glycerol-3-phosphate dehydrogenase subunit GlpB [Desulforamulus hydrothermalis]|uniref:Glycerol-3-phosphate dehydrogenase, anaerobic,B subunit n=1 Tax=Desulforamulus hydrothermalis Lam5 = DSM 18033 TaxID=1121428 RepID=K8DZS5_9FIRM|nr:anaerobic glycerol-3-phosphate dehydrogenase subunit GlpB [Desulforamulus hydrothermalis]CCO08647.1 Glycerol-3-phosphate dehydrogenase, anaerobic,B subunit [Desulforamulus hydrothermalis Lam5 = DSM 18033]SHH00356.1 glycerol 3-phosphate dehydrogenase (quinone) subunit B [Desulforamulus hydrothermalis Lam5 = DSM 18033]